MTHHPRRQRPDRLRALPGYFLLGFATVGGTWALWNHDQAFSALDYRYLAEFEYPSWSTMVSKEWMNGFDTYVDERVPAREKLLEAHAAITTDVLRDPVLNGVYVGDADGRLLQKPMNQPYREELPSEAATLAQTVRAAGAEMLWVYVPRREEVYADLLPEAWDNQYPERRYSVVEAFESTGEQTLDLTAALAADDVRDRYFFATDHHWTVDGAVTAAEAIVQALDDSGVVTGTDEREYVRERSPLAFVGTLGREVTLGATDAEPFEYLVPADGWRSRICDGDDCSQVPIVAEYLEDPDPYANRYNAWIGGDDGLVHLHNDDTAAEGTVVLIKDSYGNALAPYLAERVTDLYVIDERHYGGAALGDFFAQIGPDAVVTMHNQVSLLSRNFESSVWTDGAQP
ncbi:DHHW family protein [Demequina sp.]|uniref:DHHW family protein n=1 Tax=Demequina sp. TaxID=2050685 RepID=UPI003A850F87